MVPGAALLKSPGTSLQNRFLGPANETEFAFLQRTEKIAITVLVTIALKANEQETQGALTLLPLNSSVTVRFCCFNRLRGHIISPTL